MKLSGTWSILNGLIATLCLSRLTLAIELDINDKESIKDAASTSTYAMMGWYAGNETGQIPGAFPTKWWEGSALFLALLQYWQFTGDDQYNAELSQGMQWQSGDDGNYMPTNYSSYLGNDDQMFWGLAAIMAAEMKFPDVEGGFSWLSLAQGVFNTQTARWDTTKCGGGLRWQLFPYQDGYTMKNSISNGGLFQLSARLARYTNDDKYTKWAEKIWDWSTSSVLVNNKTWNVADSTNMDNNCADAGNYQWSYNYGTYLMGAAYMYNFTSDEKWKAPVDGLLKKTFSTFFPHGNVLEDITCEPTGVCNFNEILFKGLVSSWLAFTTMLVPETADQIKPKLQASAEAAAKGCTGNNNQTCGIKWYTEKWDGTTGMEQEISATNVFLANLVPFGGIDGPVTSNTGGDSKSNPDAGSGSGDGSDKKKTKPITNGDKAGAGILTTIFVVGWAGSMAWLLMGA
ncbi:Six-hairpin glycosidase [Penicillium brevicompactum]|uniref:Mannan endo-1,6-alpha-mannosidase n=1 Tax=Penicillium brevicompactum TaxID=5074 RepID=A0A9W9R706_PENBR|nr:Six-hairpin glycosidase [Penicillium brevicompactum]KAJ5363354.1 Six-hairpin glycosidase [Penicillium brevicompactum]